jgi:hypothetical protein
MYCKLLKCHVKGKAIPVQAWRGPKGSRRLRFPTHRLPLFPAKYSWYSFLLETDSTSGPECGRKDYINEKFQWHHRESNPSSPVCSAMPQPTAPPRALWIPTFIRTIASICCIREHVSDWNQQDYMLPCTKEWFRCGVTDYVTLKWIQLLPQPITPEYIRTA